MKRYKIIILILSATIFTACQAAQKTMSPTETMKALNEASKTKDIETTKKLVSKGTLALLEKSAKEQNTTIDELLKKDEGAPFQELPETRNEKITGDTATIEVKDTATNGWEILPFVKEDGIWKIALDKFMDGIMKRANEEMNKPPVTAPPPNADNAANNAANKPKSNSAINK
ncbi:MAG: hypothetical protein M3Q99_15560 [Acidobacteriota bacterium]|nr:hypothetical protein [Acidobacteriota bacterium]